MLAGMALAVVTYFPIYGLMASFAPTSGQLFLFVLLALTSLVLTAAAATRLALLRRTPQ